MVTATSATTAGSRGTRGTFSTVTSLGSEGEVEAFDAARRRRRRLTGMELPRADVDPDGLLEYSVVFSDRSLNHMSKRFVAVMQELVELLRTAYRAGAVAVVPGGGTYAMEAVARQLGHGRRALVIRNGFFSYRWSQIFDAGSDSQRRSSCAGRGPTVRRA